ncbi:MAG TPA: glycosyltransferase family 39 protein [Sphingomonas sp.]|jgi:hypothetical protein|uniref:glycosyltransferase family 39 protein n=1 Tax=Sphingomonas sp. TaxID=28214 RepID=UPI002ED837D1
MIDPETVAMSRQSERRWLLAILALALIARIVVVSIVSRPLVSDSAAYMEMARTLIQTDRMVDSYGNQVLYSPGYPFALALPFALFGVSARVAVLTNILLGAVATGLVWRLARIATGRAVPALLAAAGFAVLIPAVAQTPELAREHVSTPLLLLYLLACLMLVRSPRPGRWVLVGGLAFGFGLLAGVSSIFTGIVLPVAVLLRRAGWVQRAGIVAAFTGATALLIVPWLIHVDHVIGRPMMSANGGINLYIGNNPAATGYFVPIDRTPIGPHWHRLRAQLGELGLDDLLKREASAWMRADPVRTAALDARKLVYFWLPDVPDAEDEDAGTPLALIRWVGVVQHLLILALAIVAVARWRRLATGARLLVLAVLAFWAIHGIVYMITRYRAPAMPLMIVLAAIPVADGLARRRGGQAVSAV